MSGLVEHVTRWENAQLEAIFNEDLRCEQSHHDSPAFAHEHGGPGMYRLVVPCGQSVVICSPLRDSITEAGACHCPICGKHALPALRFIEL